MIKTLHFLLGALRAALVRHLPAAGRTPHVTGFTVLIERKALLPLS